MIKEISDIALEICRKFVTKKAGILRMYHYVFNHFFNKIHKQAKPLNNKKINNQLKQKKNCKNCSKNI